MLSIKYANLVKIGPIVLEIYRVEISDFMMLVNT